MKGNSWTSDSRLVVWLVRNSSNVESDRDTTRSDQIVEQVAESTHGKLGLLCIPLFIIAIAGFMVIGFIIEGIIEGIMEGYIENIVKVSACFPAVAVDQSKRGVAKAR